MSDLNEKVPGAEDAADRLVISTEADEAKRWVLVKLKGRVDVFTYLELSKRLNEQFEDKQGVNMILDLGEVVFVASSGWSVMLATRTRLKRIEGKLVLAGMNEDLLRIYQSMKLPELIPAYPSADEAKKALAGA